MKSKVWCVLLTAILVVAFCPTITTVAYAQDLQVYLGGEPIGIGLAESGLIVTGLVDVITDEGTACPSRGTDILTGDVILSVNDEPIEGIGDFAKKIQNAEGNIVTLSVKRGNSVHSVTLAPVTDVLTGLKKLGLTLKSGINGIGTLTFVTEDGKFGALGHGIVDADTGKPFLTDKGSVYSCRINGYKKPTNGVAGELSGTFIDRNHPIGSISKCNEFGVYGRMDKEITADKISVAPAKEVKTGKAHIYTTIEGDSPKAYSIEIIKSANQRKSKEKSLLIRVTDEALLSQTGGILQGMSGSPIVQDGKLIGAVTHVLVNDSTLGYGLYIDWMLENIA